MMLLSRKLLRKAITHMKMLIYTARRARMVHICRMDNGPHSDRARYKLFQKIGKSIGSNVKLRSGIVLKEPENITIGSNVSIQENCFLSGYGGIRIGNDVSIGNGTKIVSSDHFYESGIIRNNPLIAKPVVIEDNVWIGMNVCILAGSTIHERVVVAAGAVVKGEIGPNGVYGGIPARRIKDI